MVKINVWRSSLTCLNELLGAYKNPVLIIGMFCEAARNFNQSFCEVAHLQSILIDTFRWAEHVM